MSRSLQLVLALLAVTAWPAAAQEWIPGACETYIVITAYPYSPYFSQTANITVEYGEYPENGCYAAGPPNAATFRFEVNGVNRTSYFSVGASQAVGTGVPLADGNNLLMASIDGHDTFGPVTNFDYREVLVDLTPAPDVGLGMINYDAQFLGRCEAACFAATYAHTTPAYVSLDTPRSVTLVYHGDRVAPRPFVHVDVTPPGGNQPQQFWLEVKQVSTNTLFTFANGETRLHFSGSAQTVRLGGQLVLSPSTTATGVYDIQVIVTSQFASESPQTVLNTKLTVVNESGSPVARGWTIAGIQRLYDSLDANGSVLITEGEGSAVFFHKPCPTCSFTTPIGDFTRLTTNQIGGWIRYYPDSTRVWFNASGFAQQAIDRFGNTTTFVYDGGSRLWKIQDPQNPTREIVLAYSANGLSSITDPFARVTVVTVQGNRTLTAITDPGGGTTSFGYEASGWLRLTSVTDRRGSTTTFAYDGQSGKLASVTAPPVPVFGEGTVSPVTTFSAWQKAGVTYNYTCTPGPICTPATPISPDSMKATITDPGGHQARFTVNRYGQPLTMTDPLGNVRIASYNPNGQLIGWTDPTGPSASFTYDATGFMTYSSVGGFQTWFFNGGWAQPDSIRGDGPAQRIFVNNLYSGRVDSVRVGGRPEVPAGQQTVYRYTYETRGRLERATDPQGHLLVRIWYAGTNGNRSKDSMLVSRVIMYGHDTYGRQTTLSQTGQPTRTTNFDLLNRPTTAYDGVNASPVTFAYDSLFLRSVTDPRGQVYQFSYNALGSVTQRTDPLGRADVYEFSRDGELRRWTNRRGQNLDFAYDALHRRTTKSGTNTTTDTLNYTPNGRIITASSLASTETVYLNTRRQPDSVKTVMGSQTFWRRYNYTAAGRLDSVWASSTPGNLTFLRRRYRYNSAFGSLDSLRLGVNWTRFGFNPDRQSSFTRFPAVGDSVFREFASLHGMTRVSSLALYGPTIDRDLGYDRYGRITSQMRSFGSVGERWGYDGVGRLQADSFVTRTQDNCYWDPDVGYVCNPGSLRTDSVHTFNPDAVGNRLDLGGSYGTGNRIQGFNGCTYGTDFDGNVTSRSFGAAPCPNQNVTLTWSAEGRLTGFSIAGGASVAFQYDALGRLVQRSVNGSPQSLHLWDGNNLFAELNGNGTTKTAEYSYYPGLDNLHALVIGSAAHHAHEDGLGNVIALTDLNKNVSRTYQYDEWGRLTGGRDNGGFAGSDRARWKGALWMGPELELYYMRNRWYEPQTGRFLSEDPIGLEGGVNPYALAGGDPVGGSDAFGLDPCGEHSGNDHNDPPPPPATPPPPGQVSPINVNLHDCSEYRREREAALQAWESSREADRYVPAMAMGWRPIGKNGIEFRVDVDPHKGRHVHFRQRGREFGEILNRNNRLQPHGRGPAMTDRVIRALTRFGFNILRMPLMICLTCGYYEPLGPLGTD